MASAAKTVDDLLLTCQHHLIPVLLDATNPTFELGTVSHGTRHLRYFEINLLQHLELSISVDTDDKLLRIAQMEIFRLWSTQQTFSLCSIETKGFASLNASVGWLLTTA